MNILITGVAGFIGYSLAKHALNLGHTVTGIDNLNDYYSVKLKEDRLALLLPHKNFAFAKIALEDTKGLDELFKNSSFHCVVNLAAQAGVRYSLQNPSAYIQANLVGFGNILESCRAYKIKHLLYASSSSVYGLNSKMPFSEKDNVDHPVSLYAATKKSNELMAHVYSHLYNLPTTGLRFFTVYGPWGRPDMALFKFTKAILEGSPIEVFNHGKLERDFTYIDDIVDGIAKLFERPPTPDPLWGKNELGHGPGYEMGHEMGHGAKHEFGHEAKNEFGHGADPSASSAPYKIYNIGNNSPVKLMDFIGAIEKAVGKKAEINYLPMEKGDVLATCADISSLKEAVGFYPKTNLQKGIENFVNWYKEYYSCS